MKQYELRLRGKAKLALAEKVPAKLVDVITYFIYGPLLENPRRVGKPLDSPFLGCYAARRGDYRVIYLIDDEKSRITVLDVSHRSHVYAVKLADRD